MAKTNFRSVAIIGIDHVQLAMPAGEEDAARRFYVGLLGLTEVAKPAHLVARGGAWFEKTNVRIHLGIDPDFRPAKKAHPGLVVNDLKRPLLMRPVKFTVSDRGRLHRRYRNCRTSADNPFVVAGA